MNDFQHLEVYNNYVGIPWVKGGYSHSGCDCWGLVLLILDELYDIKINEYVGSKASGDKLTEIIFSEIASNKWKKIDIARKSDVVVMYDKRTKLPNHVGVYIGDDLIIHSPDSGHHKLSQIHNFRILKRVFSKLEYYRYDNNTT